MRKGFKAGVSVFASTALVASLLAMPVSAYANSSISNDVSSETSWEAPTYYMTNTVEVDGTLSKVITTWANAGALSGPDYLGVSNSGTLHQSGGSAATTDLTEASTNTMLGIWASAVNEVPNAYNWNFFYNMLLDSTDGEVDSTQVTAVNVQNKSDPGYDSQSGVWAALKYRPEIIWTSNSLTETSAATYSSQIRALTYYTSADADAVTGTDNEYYVDGDEDYDPYVMPGTSATLYTMLEYLYEMAGYCEALEADTASYNSDGTVTSDNVTWKTMNSLPRTTRYEASSEDAMSARECALQVEKMLKGSVYYTLAKIADGTVEEKKVAFVTGTIDTTGSTTTITALEGYEGMHSTLANGKIAMASLVVDQLTTDEVVATGNSAALDTTIGASEYTTYTATADELLTCDYIWCANGSLSVSEVQSWLADNATTEESKAAVETVEILSDTPALMNGHNTTSEKGIVGLYNICFFYPELYPDLELVTYWYDNIYHIYKDDLSTCLSYGLGNATMPSGVELSEVGGSTYDSDDVDQKMADGYTYYAETLSNDSFWTEESYSLAATDTYAEWATSYLAAKAEAAAAASKTTTAKKANTLTVKAKSAVKVKASKLKKKAQTIKASKLMKVSKAKGKVTYTKVSVKKNGKKASKKVAKKITVKKSTGKVTLKKGLAKGTYKVKIKVKAAGNSKYKSKTKNVTVTIKVK